MHTYRLAGTVVSSEDASIMKYFEIDYISAGLIHNYLEQADGDDVTFNLNSGGGSVFAGNEIYTMLRNYSGRVVINVTGLSASIASVFMMGADEINISPNAQIMIHLPHMVVSQQADSTEIGRIQNMLSSTEKAIARTYVDRTGISEETILQMMFEETWLTAEEALEKGFVDNILNEDTTISTDVNAMVAMVNTVGEHEELLRVLHSMKGNSMKDKSFLEKVKDLLNASDKSVGEATEETIEPTQTVELTEVQESVQNVTEVETTEVEEKDVTEQTDGSEDVQEEGAKEVDNETVELLNKAIQEIEALRNENASLRKELEDSQERENASKEELTKLQNKDSKAQDVVNKLNALLASEESKVVTVAQTTQPQNSNMPAGYSGIRAGGSK